MKSFREGMIEPYHLGRGPHLFTDWRFVRPGMVRWDTIQGSTDLFSPEGDPGIVYSRSLDVPYNIRIDACKPELAGPFFRPEKPWERIMFWNSLVYDGGKYRFWYSCVPSDYWNPEKKVLGTNLNADWGQLLCYVESDDLLTWKHPELMIHNYHGEKSNIVFGGPLTPNTGYHGGAVFIDPSAPANERYKTFYMGRIPLDQLREYEQKLGLELDPMAIHYQSAMFGAVSSDGFHWTAIENPLMLANSDTSNRVYFDLNLNKYVAYVRMWFYGRRVIGRAETDDFRRWPLPDPVMWIGADDQPANDIYTNASTFYPETTDQYLMFPGIYRRDTDTTEIRMASSFEGRMWSTLPGDPVIPTGVDGSWDGGCVFAAGDLVKMGSGQVALPYVGYSVPHKYPRFMPLGQLGFAIWQAERLSSLAADGVGGFTTPQFILPDSLLRLNIETHRSGEVLVEIAEADGLPRPVPQVEGPAFPGFSFADCDPLCGDLPAKTVSWKGNTDLSALVGKPVSLRFRMRAAKLFSFKFE